MRKIMLEFEASVALEKAKAATTADRILQSSIQDAAMELNMMASTTVAGASGLNCAAVLSDPSEACAQMHENGLTRLDACLRRETVAELLEHVNERLVRAHAALEADLNDPDALRRFGNVRRPVQRFDLKLDLCSHVMGALSEALSPLKAVYETTLGANAELFELGAFITDPTAPRQPVHPDTEYTPHPVAASTFIALQDIDAAMGPTVYLPATHHNASAHQALNMREDPLGLIHGTPTDWMQPSSFMDQAELTAAAEDAELLAESQGGQCAVSPKERMLRGTPSQHGAPMCVGDAITFDSRLLHCGSANDSPRRRILFYFSFRVQGTVTPYGRGSLDEDLQTRRLLLRDSDEWLRESAAQEPAL